MTLWTLSLKDLRRRPVRTGLTIAGVALASATLFSLLSFNVGYRQSLRKEMADSGIHMFASTEGCAMEAASLALHGGEIPKFLPEERAPAIRAVPGVRAAASMLIFSLPGEGSRTDLFYGVDDEYRKLKPHWKLDGDWFRDERSIVLGAEVARVEKRSVGDKVYFPEVDAEFTVSGVLERTGSEDDGFFFIPLKTAQRIFRKEGKLTGVGINLADVETIDTVKGELERIPDIYVVTAQQMIDQILKLIRSSKYLMFAVLGIAGAITTLGVMNTVLMSVMEKIREFGYMRCVGAAPGHVFRLVLTETAVLCVLGGVVGTILGAAGSSLADELLRAALPYAPSGRMVVLDPRLALATVGATLALGIIAGVYPSWKASAASPMEAVRNE